MTNLLASHGREKCLVKDREKTPAREPGSNSEHIALLHDLLPGKKVIIHVIEGWEEESDVEL